MDKVKIQHSRRRRRGFLADSMLARLCRRLRILGASTVFSKDLAGWSAEPSDDELIRFAAKEGLVLLTRDEELFFRAKDYVQSEFIASDGLTGQLEFLSKKYGLARRPNLSVSKSRCPKCNSPIKRISKKGAEALVWPKVFAQQKFFWRCAGCGQVYWKGSHWRRIISPTPCPSGRKKPVETCGANEANHRAGKAIPMGGPGSQSGGP